MELLVTAIMPVRGRQEWARQAVDCFVGQDWPNKQLLILQDVDALTFDEEWKPPAGVELINLSERWSIPKKRNQLCARAAGSIIVHFDSDDWSAPERIRKQVEVLEDTNWSLTGYQSVHFWDGARGYLWRSGPDYVIGSSMCYRRDWWMGNQFPETGLDRDTRSGVLIGSDNVVIAAAARQNVLKAMPGGGNLVMRVHDGNSSRKFVNNYRKVTNDEMPARFLAFETAASGARA